MLNKKKKGFTLIELIVVMAIIAILVLLAAPKYLNYTKDAHVTAMQQDAKVLSNIALGYNVKNDGFYPVTATVFATEEELPGTVTLAQINDAITTADVADDLSLANLAAFDETKTNESLQGLKNALGDYVLVISGAHEGEVIYVNKVLENSDGTSYVSVQPMVTQP